MEEWRQRLAERIKETERRKRARTEASRHVKARKQARPD